MRLDSARALKQQLRAEGYPERALTTVRASAFRAGVTAAAPPRSAAHVALGVTGQENDVKLAARIQYATQPEAEAIARDLRRRARGEIEVRRLPPIKKQATPWHQTRNRPLSIGGSISLFTPNSRFITAGTLGCFVRRRDDRDEDLILSNNHVLAEENQAARGHVAIQPGSLDGGGRDDAIGKLEKFIRLKAHGNQVDAAVASIAEGTEYYYNWLEDEGPLRIANGGASPRYSRLQDRADNGPPRRRSQRRGVRWSADRIRHRRLRVRRSDRNHPRRTPPF